MADPILTIPPINSVRIIAIDFDGTIFDRITNLPYPGAPESLKWFRRWGYELPIYSSRASSPESISWIKGWLGEHHIPFDSISNTKPPRLTWLIDDRGITFDNHTNNWIEITQAIKTQTFPWKP